MSNKTQLQTNNAALDGYIARINAAKETAAGLPEAGGGYKVATGTCTAESKVTLDFKPVLVYVIANVTGSGTRMNVACINGVINGISYANAVLCNYITTGMVGVSLMGSEILLEDDGFTYTISSGLTVASYIYVAIG